MMHVKINLNYLVRRLWASSEIYSSGFLGFFRWVGGAKGAQARKN
jgi:hypothetical protein